LIDRVLLGLLLLTVFLPLLAAALRAQGRRFEPPLTPSAFAAVSAAATALLVAYRIVQEPGSNATTTVKIGPVLALVMLTGVALGAASAFQREADYTAMRRAAATPAVPPDPGQSAAPSPGS
jgi:Kef-type K+ transport system membrane component KefB